MIHRHDLPSEEASWQPILAGAMGSPDPYKRQLNGMGGGVSSLSKICVVSRSASPNADVDFTFVQMSITDGKMDLAGTCGNMTSAVGPFAVDEGLVVPRVVDDNGMGKMATVRIWNTNTSKVVHSTFAVEERDSQVKFKSTGLFTIDGVSGTGSRITLCFLSPGGAKTGKLLPTGNPVDLLDIKNPTNGEKRSIKASLVDAANPAVIIHAADVGVPDDIQPDQLDADKSTMNLLEQVRREGARRMGLDPEVQSIPKIVMVSSPAASSDPAINLVARVLSMQQAHKAIPLTIALNLGVAGGISGSIPNSLRTKTDNEDRSVISHPGGRIEVGAIMKDGHAESAVLYRTARPLMKGEVYWR